MIAKFELFWIFQIKHFEWTPKKAKTSTVWMTPLVWPLMTSRTSSAVLHKKLDIKILSLYFKAALEAIHRIKARKSIQERNPWELVKIKTTIWGNKNHWLKPNSRGRQFPLATLTTTVGVNGLIASRPRPVKERDAPVRILNASSSTASALPGASTVVLIATAQIARIIAKTRWREQRPSQTFSRETLTLLGLKLLRIRSKMPVQPRKPVNHNYKALAKNSKFQINKKLRN